MELEQDDKEALGEVSDDDGFTVLEETDKEPAVKIDAKLGVALMACDGKLPSIDPKTHSTLVTALIDSWNISKAPDIMMVNRMVGTWMKMRRVEYLLGKYDLFFERRNDKGELIGIKMNEAAFYLKSLESDFRAYYKALDSRRGAGIQQKNTDFLEFIDVTPKKGVKKGGKK
jgi:hypothetical protein